GAGLEVFRLGQQVADFLEAAIAADGSGRNWGKRGLSMMNMPLRASVAQASRPWARGDGS
ncbi:hypothetical protein ACLBTQ_17415, partial [Pseudomonas aeruginosa]|uniref:hypothetical protein n=1 Tax=Pseudomonas aeruginosa TaxID=287 RepID=UPI003967E292